MSNPDNNGPYTSYFHGQPYPYHHTRPDTRIIVALALLTLGSILSLLIPGLCSFIWLISRPTTTEAEPFVPPASKYSIIGKPSIDADFINQVLEHYNSPARGKGQTLYNYGIKYQIDPAYALAFFMHESTFGTRGIATKTLSLGNIRATKGHPEYHGFRKYSSWEEGFEDWYRLIANTYVKKWRLYTVDQIIPVYAPTSDHNNNPAYIKAVKNAINTWHRGIVEG